MIDWLFSSVDPSRVHDVSTVVSWHGRLMVVGWGILAPLTVLVARFGKIWPGQNWPAELDNQNWWRFHWMVQTAVIAIAFLALILILQASTNNYPAHQRLGYVTLALGLIQALSGIFRGTKGGPTDVKMAGDHYDMTSHRVVFEVLHKSLGYCLLTVAIATTLTGLWAANGPVWMFVSIIIFWVALAAAFILLQIEGKAIDTYQAIWGPDPSLPGNKRKPIGWGIHRPKE